MVSQDGAIERNACQGYIIGHVILDQPANKQLSLIFPHAWGVYGQGKTTEIFSEFSAVSEENAKIMMSEMVGIAYLIQTVSLSSTCNCF